MRNPHGLGGRKSVCIRRNQEESLDWGPTSTKGVDARHSIHDGNDAECLPANQVHSAFFLQAENGPEVRTQEERSQ